jgi:uncharacterized protein (DUF1810 family)
MITFDLNRFACAQNAVWPIVLAELRAGKKRTHWMWFVFPQIAGLGSSETARKFAIYSLEEARAYLKDAILGERLRECTKLVLEADVTAIDSIFPYPDNLKFLSSMTLFSAAGPDASLFLAAIDRYFRGRPDENTLRLLERLKS